MAAPPIKIYRNGEYVAACKYFEDAAAICGMTPGTKVKWQGLALIFTEGEEAEGSNAADSWDAAAELMRSRVEAITATKKAVWKGAGV